MESVSLILALETATLEGSVCLTRGDRILAARLGDPAISHSNTLLKDLDEILEECQVSLPQVELFACASGPGSFTGLRIGIATVKALAATLGRPCLGISTLYAIAHAAGPSKATVALLPAGRAEVFVQLLSVSPDGTIAALDAASHLSPRSMLDKYSEFRNLKWAGPGAQAQQEIIKDFAAERLIPFGDGAVAEGWRLSTPEANLASHVAALAARKLQAGQTLSPHSLSANYVRPSDPELKRQCP